MWKTCDRCFLFVFFSPLFCSVVGLVFMYVWGVNFIFFCSGVWGGCILFFQNSKQIWLDSCKFRELAQGNGGLGRKEGDFFSLFGLFHFFSFLPSLSFVLCFFLCFFCRIWARETVFFRRQVGVGEGGKVMMSILRFYAFRPDL